MATPGLLSGSPAISGMPSPGASVLDGPPPSPTAMGGLPPGAPPSAAGSTSGPFSMRGLAGQIPSTGMPPEVLKGVMQAGTSVGGVLDSIAQVVPDQQAQIGLIKDLLQQVLASVMQAGGGATSPTATGPAFPGGGMDTGIAGAGSV